MRGLKEEVLLGIYAEFEHWAEQDGNACARGCSVCCTQNVTISAVEGDLIHRFIREQNKTEWFAGKLQKKGLTRRPDMTTNGFAAACLRGEDVEPASYGNTDSCPFLEDNCCGIYEVRPFSCRCFASVETCRPGAPAVIPESYLSASTAVMQIIEHLGQGEYWGNMFDVLLALSDLPENRTFANLLPASLPDLGRSHLVKALPLPGFLLLEEEMETVAPLVEAIFAHRIAERSVEDILNSR